MGIEKSLERLLRGYRERIQRGNREIPSPERVQGGYRKVIERVQSGNRDGIERESREKVQRGCIEGVQRVQRKYIDGILCTLIQVILLLGIHTLKRILPHFIQATESEYCTLKLTVYFPKVFTLQEYLKPAFKGYTHHTQFICLRHSYLKNTFTLFLYGISSVYCTHFICLG